MTKDIAIYAKNMHEDHPFILYYWPSICNRHGWVKAAETDARARIRFLDTLGERTVSEGFHLKVSLVRRCSALRLRFPVRADIN